MFESDFEREIVGELWRVRWFMVEVVLGAGISHILNDFQESDLYRSSLATIRLSVRSLYRRVTNL